MTAGILPRPKLTRAQLHVLDLAITGAGLTWETYIERVLRQIPGVTGFNDVDETRFDVAMDCFVALGFRHHAMPILSAAQLACLDAVRRRLGMRGRDYVMFLRHATGVRHRWQMTGTHFLAVMAVFDVCGVADPLPEPGFMDRRRAAALRRMVWRTGLCEARFRDLLCKFGGTGKLRQLDERAYRRVQSCLHRLGGLAPQPAPHVSNRPCFATQAQVNLLWKLWHDRHGADGNLSDIALDREIAARLGLPGGVETLTRAGARKLLDGFQASAVVSE